MKGRDIIDVKLQPWLGYKFSGGGVYYFVIRVCKYIEVANYPLIQVGVSWLDLIAADAFTIAEVLLTAPALIESGEKVPYAALSGEWTCPTDLKFDKATAPTIVDPSNYVALSVIPWTIPTFFESELEYIPISSDYSEIPESKSGYDKYVLPGNGAVFMPEYSEYSLGRRTVAIRDDIYEYSSFTWFGQFIYNGCDIDSPHVLLDYDLSHPTAADPNSVYTSDNINIDTCNESQNGFPIYEEFYTGAKHLEIGVYGAPDPEYYPPREPVVEGGGIPSFMPALSMLLSQFSIVPPGSRRGDPKI